ncbi:biotin--[acetyl-CoA-carboxylase] ligase [Paeniglutamicibacter sp. NPDC091659]|uniref:biotin--[acetyl-CoA-carboxylase] ligase n=1 Tax=Paeniglutamicibacter sp. NPDC091659 TaxID=3364389 RepID=UPI00381B0FF0
MSPEPAPVQRPPLDDSRVREVMKGLGMGELWVSQATGSTNDDLVARAKAGQLAHLSVETTEHQEAGHGRLGRGWETPDRSSLAISIYFRPDAGFDPAGLPWLSMLCGTAMVQALNEQAGLAAGLKWPNDVVAGGHKLCGVLAQLVLTADGPAVVVGTGLNVSQERAELPVPTAGSVALLGGRTTDRTDLMAGYLDRVAELYRGFAAVHGNAGEAGPGDRVSLRRTIARHMVSIGHEVDAHLPDGTVLRGTAEDLGSEGALVLRDAAGKLHHVLAADVFHLRRSDGSYA